tara:strand:- start:10735 stop:10890 length:156 start_codon:yes stop_codon:yes gene_type:complete
LKLRELLVIKKKDVYLHCPHFTISDVLKEALIFNQILKNTISQNILFTSDV